MPDSLPYFGCLLAGVVAGVLIVLIGWTINQNQRSARRWMPNVLRAHFKTADLETLLVTERRFPLHMRAELACAVSGLFVGDVQLRQCHGVKKEYPFTEVSFGELIDFESRLFSSTPQLEELNVGGDEPLRVMRNGVWLGEQKETRFAIVWSEEQPACGGGFVRMQLATPNNPTAAELAARAFKSCEQAIAEGRSYRGKILSFESPQSYTGQTSGITVHKLRTVLRDQVILPRPVLELLERNVIQFVQQRSQFARLGQSTKKGLLFYGRPGTGKTHTIHYLAKAVPEQTVFLISAEQVKYLSDYMTLARLLQPSLVVIEDVDLIAKDRRNQSDPTSEFLLNKLLNEMDGLKEDAMVLFILTTNRPEALEAALTARPGRIDQAIEFPLPDELGRQQLVRLYSKGVAIDDQLVAHIVTSTEGVSGAFIRELIRRGFQFCIARNEGERLEMDDVELALDEMLCDGGVLNRKLLGAENAKRFPGSRALDGARTLGSSSTGESYS